jgi:hypothetical protein
MMQVHDHCPQAGRADADRELALLPPTGDRVYGSPQLFVDGFTHALWVAVGFSAVGILAALLVPDVVGSRPRCTPASSLRSSFFPSPVDATVAAGFQGHEQTQTQ